MLAIYSSNILDNQHRDWNPDGLITNYKQKRKTDSNHNG